MSDPLKNIPIKVVPASASPDDASPHELEEVSMYEVHKKIYPRAVKGLFNNWRVLFVLATQLVYLGTPWLHWNGRQAVLFDLVNHKFFLFGLTIWPQDFIYLAALLMCSAFGLFTWTTIAGRLWCGYSCPQTVYTEIMLWIEKWVEGDHSKRMKLDKSPMNARKLRLKTTKHGLMIAFSLFTGFSLVGYFTPIRDLASALPRFDYGPWELFWMFFYAGFTYLFAGFMREQVCKYMCPYARFQAVMFDSDTLIISYDEERGEPRGARRKGVNPRDEGKGDCINCHICVQVCPVGIDIRQGLQYECIGCAACIDACDDVMDKMGYPRGLIRYTTENALNKVYPESQILSRLRRPRVVLYCLLLLTVISITAGSLLLRKPFKAEIIRDRASLVRETNEGWLENSYSIKLYNTTEQTQRFRLSVKGLPDIKLSTDTPTVSIAGNGSETVAVRVEADPQYATQGSHEIHFVIESVDHPGQVDEEKSSFIGE
jgi:cytochrome c oxidase accessory protein FixG